METGGNIGIQGTQFNFGLEDGEDGQGLHILPSRYRLRAGNAGASASSAYRASNYSSVCSLRSYLAAMLLLYLPPYQSFVPGQQVDDAATTATSAVQV